MHGHACQQEKAAKAHGADALLPMWDLGYLGTFLSTVMLFWTAADWRMAPAPPRGLVPSPQSIDNCIAHRLRFAMNAMSAARSGLRPAQTCLAIGRPSRQPKLVLVQRHTVRPRRCSVRVSAATSAADEDPYQVGMAAWLADAR